MGEIEEVTNQLLHPDLLGILVESVFNPTNEKLIQRVNRNL